MTDRTLTVRLRAIADQYVKQLEGAGRVTDQLGDKIDRMSARAPRNQDIGKGMMKSITAPTLLAGAAIVKVAGDYDQSMREIQALTGASASTMEKLSGRAKQMGADTKFSASEAADAMAMLIKGGFDAEQAYAALPGVMQLAAASSLDIASAADIATNVMSGMGLAVGDLARVNDVLSAAANQSDTDVSELGEAFKMVGPIARAQNMSLEDTSAILAVLAENGIRGTMAGTSLRGMMGSLLAPSGEAADVMKRLGINVLDASGNLLPMTTIVDKFTKAGASSADIYQVFGRETAGAFQSLVGSGVPALSKMTSALEDSAGTAQRLADAKMGGLSGAIEELRGSVEGLAIAAGEAGAADFISALADGGVALANGLSSANPVVLKFGLGILALAAAAGPAIWAFGKLQAVYGPVVDGAKRMIGALQGVQVQLALARAEGLSTGQALAAMFGPQAAVLAGLAALAGVLYLVKKQSDDFAKSHVTGADAAMELAKSANLATKEIGAMADAQERAVVTADDFRLANEQAILTLRTMGSDDTRKAFLLQIGYELVLRGASPEDALKQVQKLASAAGVEVPVDLSVSNIADFENQLDSVRQQARSVAETLKAAVPYARLPGGSAFEGARGELDRIAQAAADAFNTQGPAAYAAVLAEAEKQLGSNSTAMGHVVDRSLELTKVQNLNTTSVGNTVDALRDLSSAESSAGAEQKQAAKQILDLAGAMNGGLTPANIAAAAATVVGGKSALDYADAAAGAEAGADGLADGLDGAGGAAGGAADQTQALTDAVGVLSARLKLSRTDLAAAEAAAQAFMSSIADSTHADDQLEKGLAAGSALRDLRKGLLGEADAAGKAKSASKKVTSAVDEMGDAFKMADPKMSAVTMSLDALKAAGESYRRSIEQSTGGMQDQISTALDLGDAYRDFRKIVKKLPEDIDQQGAALGKMKPRQADAIRDVAKLGAATTQYLATLLESGRGADYVRAEAKRLTAEYAAQMRQAGLSEEAIAKYIRMIGTAPDQVETAIKVSGEDQARFKIQSYMSLLEGRIPPEVATQVTAQIEANNLEGAAQTLAKWAKGNPQTIDVDTKVDTDKITMKLPKAFDPLKAALGEYTDEESAALEGLQKLGAAAQDYLSSLIGSGEVDTARDQADKLRQAYHDQLAQLGLNETEIQSYLDMLGLTPTQIETAIVVSGEEEARFKIETYNTLLGSSIPAEVKSEVLALIDEGKLAEAAARLKAWRESEGQIPIVVPIVAGQRPQITGVQAGILENEGRSSSPPPGGYQPGASAPTATKPGPTGYVDADKKYGLKVPGPGDPQTKKDNQGRPWKYDASTQKWYPQFGRGGLVPDYGTGPGDTVRANIKAREFVMSQDAVRRHGVATLEAMNRGAPIPGTSLRASDRLDAVSGSTTATIDRADIQRLIASMPEGGDNWGGVTIVSPNPRRAAEDLVRVTGSKKWTKGGRRG